MINENIEFLKNYDPEIGDAIGMELARQRRGIELIASENFVSPAVLAAMGSPLTNKYAEGYPGKRYYGGCECVDIVENIAIERAKKLFGAEHANVQPHSGAQANLAVYFALLSPGDKVLGMSLADGGHLTHGSPVNLSGSYYNFISYGVDETTHRIDYDKLREKALAERPKLIVAGASAYPRAIDFKCISEIAHEVGAYRRSCGGGTSSESRAVCGCCHHHNAQNAPRTSRRYDSLPRRACAEDKQSYLPRNARRTSHAHYRGKSRLLRRGAQARIYRISEENRQ